jgi:putative ABC transport system permease protein
VALLSHGLWRSRFGAETKIVGQSIHLDSGTYEVIGVLPPDFDFAGDHDLWIALGLDQADPGERSNHSFGAVGRLAPGVKLAQASSELDRIAAKLERNHPRNYGDTGWGLFPSPLQVEIVGDIKPALLVLFGAAGFVLLVACANIANLLLARSASREREIAIRAALGAGRFRLTRQLLTEGLLLSLLGSALGVLLASWGMSAFQAFGPDVIPRLSEVRLDYVVLSFTFALTFLTGIVFSVIPVVHLAADRSSESLKEGARGDSGLRSTRMRSALVVSEIALALVLLIGAGLMIRSYQQLLAVEPGFETGATLTFRTSLPPDLYISGQPVTGFYKELAHRIRALPGVRSVGAVSHLPLSGSGSSGSVFIEDTEARGLLYAGLWNAAVLEADRRYATPGYFRAMGIPVLSGRLFEETDDQASPRVVIVDRSFAEHIWPDRDPIGQRVAFYPIPGSDPPAPLWWTVVGVVGHVKHDSLRAEGREQIYMPHAQTGSVRTMTTVVRTDRETTGLTETILRTVSAVDADLPLYDVRTIQQTISASMSRPRLNLSLVGGFAVLALILSSVGTYGVATYSASERFREIGILMALGAERRDILRLMLGQGFRLTLAGVAIGSIAAFVLTRLLSSQLFGIHANDPLTYIAITLLLTGVAVAATFIPARRATKTNPLAALRCE